ncbi:ankyrin repeat-containing domain protein [Camillea tinctor]|nr:ankyrin repeat-containing domain protein [Camillea tinctor]
MTQLQTGNHIIASTKKRTITSLPGRALAVLASHLDITDISAVVKTCKEMQQAMTCHLYLKDVNSGYNRAMTYGCIHGNLAIVTKAVEFGAPVNPTLHPCWPRMMTGFPTGFLPLTLSIAPDRVNVLRFLLEHGASTTITPWHKHPLLLALDLYKHCPVSEHQTIEIIISCLLKHGASPHSMAGLMTPFQVALDDHVPTRAFLRLLLSSNLPHRTFDGRSPWEYQLQHCELSSDQAVRKFFFTYGVSKGIKGRCPIPKLKEIVRFGTKSAFYVLYYLLQKGKDPNGRDGGFGNTIWTIASRLNELSCNKTNKGIKLGEVERRVQQLIFTEMMKLLLKMGASPNNTEYENKIGLASPLILLYASRHDYSELIRELLAHGADTTCVDDSGFTALHWAFKKTTLSISRVKILLEHGANVNAQNKDGMTPLHQVSYYRIDSKLRMDLLLILIEAGADVTLRDNKGNTACDLARRTCEWIYPFLIATEWEAHNPSN